MSYQAIPRRSRQVILRLIESNDPNAIHEALDSAAYWDEDWRWAQTLVLRFAQHESEQPQGTTRSWPAIRFCWSCVP